MAITPIPTPVPQRSDPANFPARADAVMTALPTFVTEANALQVDVNNKQSLAANSQAAALQSELNAQASASAAAASSAATVWVSGTTYTAGQVRFSPTDYRSYRRRTNGAGTTDPVADIVNWQLISNGPTPFLHVREEQPPLTGGMPSVVGLNTRVLNTVVTNTINGASLASNIITLPAGTYEIDATAPCQGNGASHKLVINNITDNTNMVGVSGNTNNNERSRVVGRFTITSTKTFRLDHYVSVAGTLGASGVGLGFIEVLAEAQIWRVA